MGKHCTKNIKRGIHYIFLTVNDNRGRRVIGMENSTRTSRMTVPEFSQLFKPILSHDIAVSH